MLRRYARDGLSFRRAQVAFSLDGYERSVYALKHKARARRPVSRRAGPSQSRHGLPARSQDRGGRPTWLRMRGVFPRAYPGVP
jgi:hypothetical protein